MEMQSLEHSASEQVQKPLSKGMRLISCSTSQGVSTTTPVNWLCTDKDVMHSAHSKLSWPNVRTVTAYAPLPPRVLFLHSMVATQFQAANFCVGCVQLLSS